MNSKQIADALIITLRLWDIAWDAVECRGTGAENDMIFVWPDDDMDPWFVAVEIMDEDSFRVTAHLNDRETDGVDRGEGIEWLAMTCREVLVRWGVC